MSISLGDRMKRYEASCFHVLTNRTPVIIRVDGRAFHTYTRNMKRPFDHRILYSMVGAAIDVSQEMDGFKAAYIQSDEATFCLTDYDNFETQPWFDNKLSKIVSISAALMSVRFAEAMQETSKLPVFDSRAFNVPRSEVVNCFLWRAQDWSRNSLQMYARANFSHNQLHGKGREDMHDMLHSIGKNWSKDLSDREKNGTFLLKADGSLKVTSSILPNYNSISTFIDPLIYES